MVATPLNPETRQLRETIELLSRKVETLERRLVSTPGIKRGVKTRDIHYVGSWPQWRHMAVQAASTPQVRSPSSVNAPALRPHPGNSCLTLRNSGYRLLGLAALQIPDERLEGIVGYFARWQRQAMNFVPVFVTDSLRFDLFRRYGFVFEYIPGPKDRAELQGSRSWEEYVADRLELIKAKWGLRELVNLGQNTIKEISGPGESALMRWLYEDLPKLMESPGIVAFKDQSDTTTTV
jgi:hypothetical protein